MIILFILIYFYIKLSKLPIAATYGKDGVMPHSVNQYKCTVLAFPFAKSSEDISRTPLGKSQSQGLHFAYVPR